MNMKKYSFTVFCLAALLLAGCSQSVSNGLSSKGESVHSNFESVSADARDTSETEVQKLSQSAGSLFDSEDLYILGCLQCGFGFLF